jgi:hypothetical protein
MPRTHFNLSSASRFADSFYHHAVPLSTTGNVFYVDSGAGTATGPGYTPETAYSTIDAAVGACTATNGDVIIVMEGHAETVIADSGIDVDVAGVRIIGMGRGASRPTVTFGTAVTADLKLAAAGCSIENLLFIAAIDALTGPIEVSAADCAVINCEYRDAACIETTDVLTVITGGTRCLVDGFKYVHIGGTGGTQQQSIVNVATDVDGVEVCNCYIASDGAIGGIEFANATNLNCHHNIVDTSHANDVAITLGATSTGMVYDNRLKIATDGQATWITATNDCALFENYGVNADGQTGGLIGTVST